ncbi:hypothetical protein DPMN_056162 [Dreissena polymorpha]|uniref:Heat shock protein 70 n=2 Tax=Dreissena polymorpha TaxID=45954 RepID=A0A9D4HT87_DREPO|nr:hypothetical protein DPMN_056162 [Dreissena polymorpha]
MQVDEAFMQFLTNVYGTEIMSKYIADTASILELRKDFEAKKRNFMYGSTDWIRFNMSYIGDLIAETAGTDISTIHRRAHSKFGDKIEFNSKNKLSIHPDVMKGFFDSALDGIITFIQKLRHGNDLEVINTVLLVGGLAEVDYIQHTIQHKIKGTRVIVPPDPALAVLKGAVIFAQNPKAITERIARFSYGFSVARKFEEKKDPENLKVVQNDDVLCMKVFDRLISKGESVKNGTIRLSLVCKEVNCDNFFSMLLSSVLPVMSEVYRSENKDPKYTATEQGTECIGRIVMMPPPGGWPPMAIIAQGLIVGESELRAFAKDIQSNKVVEARLDCL